MAAKKALSDSEEFTGVLQAGGTVPLHVAAATRLYVQIMRKPDTALNRVVLHLRYANRGRSGTATLTLSWRACTALLSATFGRSPAGYGHSCRTAGWGGAQ